jgi:hypothetical protein
MAMFTRSYWRNLIDRGRNISFRDEEASPTKGTSIWEMFPLLACLDPKAGFVLREDFLQLEMDDTTHNPTGWTYTSDTAAGAVTLPNGECNSLTTENHPADPEAPIVVAASYGRCL